MFEDTEIKGVYIYRCECRGTVKDYIFYDDERDAFFFDVTKEFIKIVHCPFCGRKLEGLKE